MSETSSSMDSLKEEIHDLKSQLEQITIERNQLLIQQNSHKSRQEMRHISNNDPRLTELHSVIAELKKQLERRCHNNKIILEVSEEEEESSSGADDENVKHSLHDDNNTDEYFEDDNLKFIMPSYNNNKSKNSPTYNEKVFIHIESPSQKVCENFCEKSSKKVSRPQEEVKSETYQEIAKLSSSLCKIRTEQFQIRQTLQKKEMELGKAKCFIADIEKERELLRGKVHELEWLLKENSQGKPEGNHQPETVKHAKTIKLKTCKNSQPTSPTTMTHLTGKTLNQITSRLTSTKIAEQLLHPIMNESTLMEICNKENSEKEFELEFEKLNCRIEHLQINNEVLNQQLYEAKVKNDQLVETIAQFESNQIAMGLAIQMGDSTIKGYDILVALLESELGQLLANCRAAGIGSYHSNNKNSKISDKEKNQEEINVLLHKANENRHTATTAAFILLNMMEQSNDDNFINNNNNSTNNNNNDTTTEQRSLPWGESNSCCEEDEELQGSAAPGNIEEGDFICSSSVSSSTSDIGPQSFPGSPSTTTTKTKNTTMTKLTSPEPQIRSYIISQKTQLNSVRSTILDLSSNWSIPDSIVKCDPLTARRMDLETAVLMQELMALREERAELRAQLYLHDKQNMDNMFRIKNYEHREELLNTRILFLKEELGEIRMRDSTQPLSPSSSKSDDVIQQQEEEEELLDGNANNNSILRATDVLTKNNSVEFDREKVLQKRVQDLSSILDRVICDSNIREKQTQEMSNELKHANEMLIHTLESVKKKYEHRIKKMEDQFINIIEKHSLQIKFYKDQLFKHN